MQIIDLTHILNENITVYPDTIGPKFENINNVDEHGFAEMKVEMVLHSGTHIDAPCHILKGTKSLDQFPLDKFIGKAIVIPCLGKNEIDVEFLKTFEKNISMVDFVLFYTGWQDKWGMNSSNTSIENPNIQQDKLTYYDNCPVPTQEAAQWLTQFKLKGIGIDSFSVDKIVSAHIVNEENLPNHYILLHKEIILIENLTNLDKLPDYIFIFQCMPLKIENADGSPVRAMAIID